MTTAGKPFRHGGHGETDRGHEQLQELRPAQQPQPEQQRDDAQRRPDEDAPERVELLLKRGPFLRARLFNQSGDAAQLGVHRRGHDDGLAGARRDAGAHEHHVLAVAERNVVPVPKSRAASSPPPTRRSARTRCT